MTFIKDKYVRGNKEHRCALCNDKIAYRERHRFMQWSYGKGVESARYHCECSNAISDFCNETQEEEYTARDVMRLVNEKLNEKGIEPAPYIHDAVKQLYGKENA